MRKLAILAALASTALATPAVARDHTWYAGIEGGAMLVEDTDFDFHGNVINQQDIDIKNAITLDHKIGADVDLIGGYDFGMFRVEAEAGWKSAGLDDAFVDGLLINSNSTVINNLDGDVRVLSAMVNGLLDFGDDDGWNGYVGGGIGLASVKHHFDLGNLDGVHETDSSFAWQVIAGVRKAVSDNLDVGLKY